MNGNPMKAMLRFENVTSGYGGIPINRDITLEVTEGQILAIVGRNGVGKSTLARTIVGLLRPSAGRIFFDGRDVTCADARKRAIAGMGYVPQGREIFGRLTVEENSIARNFDRCTITRSPRLAGCLPAFSDFARAAMAERRNP